MATLTVWIVLLGHPGRFAKGRPLSGYGMTIRQNIAGGRQCIP
jgi:hypothetical protein